MPPLPQSHISPTQDITKQIPLEREDYYYYWDYRVGGGTDKIGGWKLGRRRKVKKVLLSVHRADYYCPCNGLIAQRQNNLFFFFGHHSVGVQLAAQLVSN